MQNRFSKNSAVTMISLLVGVALGTFLIIVMLQIFAATRANYRLSRNINELDNVVRYASIVMNDIIRQAGYRTPSATTGELPSYASVFQPFNTPLYGPTGSEYDTGTYPNSDDPAGTVLSYFPGENVFVSALDPDALDKLWVKFEGNVNGLIRDCNDIYGDDSTPIKVRFYSRSTTVSSGVTKTGYYCERQDDNTTYTYTDAPSGTPIIPTEVFDEAFVRYGEDLTGNGYIDRWALGPDVIDRDMVYAVRVAFLLHTRDPVRSADVTQNFYVFDETVSFTDQYIHKLYMFTIFLPNAPNYDLLSAVVTP